MTDLFDLPVVDCLGTVVICSLERGILNEYYTHFHNVCKCFRIACKSSKLVQPKRLRVKVIDIQVRFLVYFYIRD